MPKPFGGPASNPAVGGSTSAPPRVPRLGSERRAKDAAQRRHSPDRQIKSLAARRHRHCLAQGEQAGGTPRS